jgi:hypothetical protein
MSLMVYSLIVVKIEMTSLNSIARIEELTIMVSAEMMIMTTIWGMVAGIIAHMKGHDSLLFFILGGMSGWIGSIFLWFFLPDQRKPDE